MDREFKMQHTTKDGWFRKVELTIIIIICLDLNHILYNYGVLPRPYDQEGVPIASTGIEEHDQLIFYRSGIIKYTSTGQYL